jgi:hypothetical protein
MQSTFAASPRSKREPDDGEQLRLGNGSRLSVAEKVTGVPSGDVASTVSSLGSSGRVRSTLHDQFAGVLVASPFNACTENE